MLYFCRRVIPLKALPRARYALLQLVICSCGRQRRDSVLANCGVACGMVKPL